MELTLPIVFSALSILVGAIRYGTYIWSIFRGQTKPHIFTWLNLGIITGIGTVAQYQLNGGPSTWALAFVAASCLFIAGLSLKWGEKRITRSDWLAFITALAIIPIWQVTTNPILAITLVICLDFLCYYPTLRKSWNAPFEEPVVSYIWSGLRYLFALLAVSEPSLSSLMYPIYLMMTDWGVAIYLYWRQSVVSRQSR